jgi:serine/threonine protein kinase
VGSEGGTPTHNDPAPSQIGRYRILATLGSGGMGTVYLGRMDGPRGFQRLVGLKVMRPHLAGDRMFVDMFLEEARISAQLRHPNVVSTHEAFFHDGSVVLVMDYVRGESLMSILRRLSDHGLALPIDLALYLVASICEGLSVIHEQGFVHCDISPENILVDEHGIAKLSDFGVATAMRKIPGDGPRLRKGKICYMAPEQITAAEFDARADIFALGIVLWEATVGRRLFRSRHDTAGVALSRTGTVEPPSSIIPDYPQELEAIVLKALQEDPAERFVSARDLGRALRDFGRKSGAEIDAVGANQAIESFPKDPTPPMQIEPDICTAATEMALEQGPTPLVADCPDPRSVSAPQRPATSPPVAQRSESGPHALPRIASLDEWDSSDEPSIMPLPRQVQLMRSQKTLARNVAVLSFMLLLFAACPTIKQRLTAPAASVRVEQVSANEAMPIHREPSATRRTRAVQVPAAALNRASLAPSLRSVLPARSSRQGSRPFDLYGPDDL